MYTNICTYVIIVGTVCTFFIHAFMVMCVFVDTCDSCSFYVMLLFFDSHSVKKESYWIIFYNRIWAQISNYLYFSVNCSFLSAHVLIDGWVKVSNPSSIGRIKLHSVKDPVPNDPIEKKCSVQFMVSGNEKFPAETETEKHANFVALIMPFVNSRLLYLLGDPVYQFAVRNKLFD